MTGKFIVANVERPRGEWLFLTSTGRWSRSMKQAETFDTFQQADDAAVATGKRDVGVFGPLQKEVRA